MTLLWLVEISCALCAIAPAARDWWIHAWTPSWRTGHQRFVRLTAWISAYSATVMVVALWAPLALHLLAAICLLFVGRDLWRSASWRGRRRSLPRGSLLHPRPGIFTHEFFFLEQARRFGPIFKARINGAPTICIVGHKTALELLQQQAAHLSRPGMPFNRLIPRGFLRHMSSADRAFYRPKLIAILSPNITQANRDRILAAARHGYAQMASSDRGSTTGLHPREPLERIVLQIMAQIFFGIEARSALADQVWELHRALCIEPVWMSAHPDKIAAFAELGAIVDAQVTALSANNENDAPQSYLENCLRLFPELAANRTIRGNLIYMLHTGTLDVAGLMTWIFKMLGDYPDCLEALRREVDSALPVDDEHDLATCVVRETLRLEQTEYLIRKVDTEFRFAGYTFPRNWLVRVCIREGHRDPEIYEHPNEFRPERFRDHSFSNSEYAPLGLGEVRCLGKSPVLQIGATLVRELTGFDLAVLADGRRQVGNLHWRPSSRLRVALTPRRAKTAAENTL
ncbi:MAG: cytochrome P450 [Planctomycetota bacterium]